MIRTFRHCSRLATSRAPLVTSRIPASNARSLSAVSAATDQCHRRLVTQEQRTLVVESEPRFFSTASALRIDEEEDALPSNLQFDRKSSFAPQDLTILKPPVVAPDADVDDDDDDEDDNELAEASEGDEEEQDEDVDVDVKVGTPQFVIPLPERLKVDIRYKGDGSVSGTVWLEEILFGADPIRVDLLKQSVDFIRNKIRGRRKNKTKTIGEVSGSGRKVRQQKGTGKARAGHSRPAHWRGGAKAHGPKTATDYGKVKMNKKTKRLAMISALSQKLKEGNLIVIDDLLLESHKTGPWASLLLEGFGVGREAATALIVDHYLEDQSNPEVDAKDAAHASFHGVPINLWVASGNIPRVKVVNQRFMNVYEILKKEKLIVTLGAIQAMEDRWMN